MKQSRKQASLFQCLFCRRTRDRDTKMLLPSSASVDSVFRVCGSDGGLSNSTCDAGDHRQKTDGTSSDSGVDISSLSSSSSSSPTSSSSSSSSSSSFTGLSDLIQWTVMPTPPQPTLPRPCSSSRFVFVVAADMEETDRLDRQVDVFCQSLQAWGISYVVVKSTCEWPLLSLPERVLDRLPRLKKDFKSVQEFIWSCYKRASKVLMLVSPGYLRYADGYTEGAEAATTHQQRVMRKIQEKLKLEFFDQKRTFRIWPVLLQDLKANRVHVPSFLGHSIFYWFPCTQGLENVMDVLKEDLTATRSSSVKRSF